VKSEISLDTEVVALVKEKVMH